MLCFDRVRWTNRTVAYVQRHEFSTDVKFHGEPPADAPKALVTAVSACVENALDGRELVGGAVDIKLHVKVEQEDKVVSFREKSMCAAEQAVRKMDAECDGWCEKVVRRGSVEIFLACTVKNVLDSDPQEWWLAERQTHAQVLRERAIVEKQGWDPAKMRPFDFRHFRSGQMLLTTGAARRVAIQHAAAKRTGRVVPYPLAPQCKELKQEPMDKEFQDMERQPINF